MTVVSNDIVFMKGRADDRDIEGTSTQVIHENVLFVHSRNGSDCHGSRARLVDRLVNMQARSMSRADGGINLRILEKGRNRNHQ